MPPSPPLPGQTRPLWTQLGGACARHINAQKVKSRFPNKGMNMQSWAQTEANLCQVKGQRLSEAPYAFKVRVDNKDIQSGLKNQMWFFFL